MFAAASGARLAHRHNKTVKKQISASQIEGLQVQYKGFQRQQQLKYSEAHGNRFAGIPHKRANYSTKLYCDPNLKLSSSYIDISGRITKLGHVDFEGKAAWQDRELNHDLEPRVSICVPNEAAITHRTKQREAHSRWVKRNRIHDLSLGGCSSDEVLLYGVQNGAANLLLYVGLGTMCVGMIIAFVGTGEKGFKTMELRLIGPSLIGVGVLIIIFRIMLCVCPSKCLKLKKHKQKLKNSMNKLNSEGNQVSEATNSSKEPFSEENKSGNSKERKKCISIAMLPTTSGLSTNSSENTKAPKATMESPILFVVPTITYFENEKSEKSSENGNRECFNSFEGKVEGETKTDFELKQFNGINYDVASVESAESHRINFSNLPETLVSPDNSDISINSLINISSPQQQNVNFKKEVNISKYELNRIAKNIPPMEIVLDPSSLSDSKETE